MTRLARVTTWLALATIVPAGLLASTADLPVTPGRGVQLVWTTGEWATCAPYQFDAFPSAMDFWNVEGPNEYCYETEPYDDAPVLTAVGHMAIIDGARFLAMDTHGTGDGKGWYSAEYYLTPDSAAARLLEYYDSGFDSTLIRFGMTSAGTPVLSISYDFVEWYGGDLDSRAIVDLGWCCSSVMAGAFVTLGATTVMAYGGDVSLPRLCRNFEDRWRRFACGDPRYTSQANSANDLPEAELITATGSYDEESNSINLEYDCENWAARFLEWGVDHGGGILFLTNYERNSDLFEVYGYAGGERRVLATLRPEGDASDRIRAYHIDVPPGLDSYQIAEIDSTRMWRTLSERKRPGDSDPALAELAGFEGKRLMRPAPGPASYEEIPRAARKVGPLYGDAVVYCRDPAVAAPLADQLRGQGLETVLHAGNGTAADVRAAYAGTYDANVTRNGELGEARYPVWPGPELYIVGKASDGTVSTNWWPDDPFGTCGQPSCTGDFDYTDVDEDGRPNGPVARLFASTREEVERYVHFSNRYDGRGGGRVLLCEGDLTAATGSTYVAPGRWLDRVEAALSAETGSTIRFRRSDHPSSAAASAAGRDLINGGVSQIWAMGNRSGYKRIPSSVAYGSSYDAALLTTDQAFLLFAPGCEVSADWGWAVTYGLLLNKLFKNEPGRSGCAGAVAHWSGGWGEKHDLWANYVLEEYEAAPRGLSMAELVWRAFIRCTDEAPWMETYCRSAVYVGARTRLKESAVHVESADRSLPGALAFRIAPTVLDSRGCEVWFDLPHPTRVSLKVYDVRGRLVRSIEDRFAMAGRHVSAWDGNDESGGAVAPGVYFVRLATPRGAVTRKAVVIR